MRYTVGSPSMQLLRLASRFAQPDGDGSEGGEGGDGGAGSSKAGEGGDAGKSGNSGADGKASKKEGSEGEGADKKPVPYDRFSEVNKARRTAERALATAQGEIETLKSQLQQAQSGDQAAALKAAQEEVTALKQSMQAIDDEFEDMLEVALADMPKEQAEMVREIPGGARAQFAWFNKHRARLAGDTSEKNGGPKGPKNERKPDGGDGKPGPSSRAKQYVEAKKVPEKGFAGLA